MKDMNSEKTFKGCGLKNTKSRLAILDILERSAQPLSAEQIFLELKEKNISTNLSTVYRTLDTLTEKRLVTKLQITGDSRALFEYNRMAHKHYLICLECKKITAIESCPLGDYVKALAQETDYSISGHKLDIYGYCPSCRKKT